MATTYPIYLSNGTLLTTINPSTFDDTTNLSLLGKGVSNYGDNVATDLVHLVENFTSTQTIGPPGVNPNLLGSPLTGQLWYDNTSTPSPAQAMRFYDPTIAGGSPLGWHALLSEVSSGANLTVNSLTATTSVTAEAFIATGTSGAGVPVYPSGTASSFLRRDSNDGPTAPNAFTLGNATYMWANIYSTLFTGTATAAEYSDLAERYEADCALEEGDLVSLGGEKEITKSRGAEDIEVFGVVSLRPAFRMNAEAGNNETHPYIALAGRIPCKVLGQVKKGQRLVASEVPGVAIAAASSTVSPFSVFGRALANKTTDGVGLVEVVVGSK
jgi:hypothetical protein